MGGCRCTYRNCSLRTDGKTHMFHYPVFDKVRCHQWLTNAHKLEFLNLKVSQLKNRVVCQHHFRDEHFMNFKKAKLTFDAVPTEDGPYCDSGQLAEKKTEQYDTKTFGISLDDIENEYLTIIDKKANFSVKYGDFLTNCDIMELDSLTHISSDNSQVEMKSLFEQPNLNDPPKDSETAPVKEVPYATNDVIEPTNIILNENVSRKKTVRKVDPVVGLDLNNSKNNLTQTEQVQNTSDFNHRYVVPIEFENKSGSNQSIKTDAKRNIRIISEKRISKPVPLRGTLEPLSPRTVLPLPKKKKKNSEVSNIPEPSANNVTEASINLTDTLTHNVQNDQINVQQPQTTTNISIKSNNKVSPKRSLLKNRIPPERVAAIAEKRKFNMKLRDIVEDCLDKLDEPVIPVVKKRKITPSPKKQEKEQAVRNYLSKEKELPNINEYTIAYLEARMKKMENNLLNKIDQNSQKIVDLKQTFPTSTFKTSNVSTQTLFNEHQHKKQLYNEISKYLSHKANSLIYEELFIDKYTHEKYTRSSSTKRSKCD
ncbi:unnamed protein product [Chrysodeixis includens]|uniref:THAP-type domain-containing protein n=1 Tax=Chrysodeixis includens TaxID=689277 RepID=A0A9P0FUJ4_CHRIL|nr:unnamed protein product [Chrysodeixis includens]